MQELTSYCREETERQPKAGSLEITEHRTGGRTGRTGDPSMTGEKSQWLVSRGKDVAEHRPMGAPF